MADLTTSYLGLTLKNPIIAGASNLTNSVKNIIKVEKYGAGAVVLNSIFEEQIVRKSQSDVDQSEVGMHPEAPEYVKNVSMDMSIHKYLSLIEEAKKAVSIPVIASVNCYSGEEWTEFSKKIESAGADALELNIFLTDFTPYTKSGDIENGYLKIIKSVRKHIKIPLVIKLGYYFTNLIKMISLLDASEINGLVLFNRFLRHDINLETQKVISGYPFSGENDFTGSLRWIALVSNSIKHEISASTGVFSGETALKYIFVGAKTVQVCSALHLNGIDYLDVIIKDFNKWLDMNGYEKADQVRGLLSCKNEEDIELFERSQFMKY